MKTKILLALLLVSPAWISGCEYYAAAPRVPVQRHHAEPTTGVASQDSVDDQDSADETILPQTNTQPDETGRSDRESKNEEPKNKEPENEEPEPVDPPSAPKPEMSSPASPRASQLIGRTPNLFPRTILSLPPQSNRLALIGSGYSAPIDLSCGDNEAITSITETVHEPEGDFMEHLSFGCTEINDLAAGTWGSTESTIDFGGGETFHTSVTISPIALELKFAFAGYVAYRCKTYGRKYEEICALRPFARPVTDSGVDRSLVWLGPVVGVPSSVTTALTDDDRVRDAALRHANEMLDPSTYVASCPSGHVLTGFSGGAADMVEYIAGVCKPVAVSQGN